MKNGRFAPKDKSFSKRDKERSEAGNCSYSSFVTLILGLSGLAALKVTLMTLPNTTPLCCSYGLNEKECLAYTDREQ